MERQPAKIHLVAHFHYDPVWIEDQRTYTNHAFDLVRQYLDECRKDPDYHIILSEVDYLRPFLTAHGEDRAFISELVAAGRISTGGAYSEPNEMTIQGEPLIRNLLYGRLFHEGVLAAKPTVYMPLDVFGHCVQLPQLARKSGFKAIVWSKDIVGALPLCFQLAPDASSLLQKHEHYWYHPETFEQFLDTVADGLENQAALGLSHDLRLLGMDMAAPRPWLAARWAELGQLDPAVVPGTPEKYLAAVSNGIDTHRQSIPVSGRDLSFFHAGTLITRAELKIANRLAENRLLGAERWATLASLLGAVYPDVALDKAWRQLLFGQHHDGITGCLSDIPFLDLLESYRESLDIASGVEARALDYITSRADTAAPRRAPRDGAALVVFNPMSWERTDVCRARVRLEGALTNGFKVIADNGREVPTQLIATAGDRSWAEIAFLVTDVPSVGYRTYYLAPASAMPPMPEFARADEARIENETLAIAADPARGGGLSSIYSKSLKKEFIDKTIGVGGELVALSEQPDRDMPPWELFTTGAVLRSGDSPATVEVLKGPVFSQLRATTRLPDRCDLIQEWTLYRGLPRLDLRTTIRQYHGLHELLALGFPFDEPGAAATFEDRFATVVRRRSIDKFDFRTSWHRNISRCGIGAAQNWVDVGPAPSLRVMSGARCVGAMVLGPCVIVTSADAQARAAARMLMTALLSRGVTCTHRLDTDSPEGDAAACLFRISLGARNSYSAKLLDANPAAAARLAETASAQPWSGVVIRRPDPAGEWPDTPVLIADTGDAGGVAKLGELLAAAVSADDLSIAQTHDFSGLAAAVPGSGIALINRGAIAASLESDGTLVAPLFHTSAWSTHNWGEGRLDRFFIPEHRTHVFEHSLLPHERDWRGGQVVRAGHEVNSPLRAVQSPIQPGVLPTSFSLVSVDATNVVAVGIKPLGNPLAEQKPGEHSNPFNGVLVRAYEVEGRPITATIRFGAPLEAAWATDLMENKSRELTLNRSRWKPPTELRLDLSACEIVSVAAMLLPPAEVGPPRELGPSAEPYSPIYTRYWDHNLGAAPMGNLPVSLWLRGPVPLGHNTRFPLGVNNERRDREISGTVNMIAPPEWTMIPRQLPYRIAPNSPAIYEVMVIVPPDARPCFIRATTKQGDYEVQDVIPVGDVKPLETELRRDADGFTVTVRNPNADYIEGQLSLITPLETWGEPAEGHAIAGVSPRTQPFRLEANEQRDFAFTLTGESSGIWAIAKVCWYGNVRYVQAG